MWVSNVHKVSQNTSDGAYTYQVWNMTDPDEFANFKNNGAFTSAGVRIVMLAALQASRVLNVTPSADWVDVGDNTLVPVDPTSGIVLEYSGFNGTTGVKQGNKIRCEINH